MSSDEEFIGPLVQVLVKEPGRGGMLENVHLRQRGGRQFIVGKLADSGESPPDPRVGVTYWFAWEEVVMLADYPDLATAQRQYQRHKQRNQAQEKTKRRSWWR